MIDFPREMRAGDEVSATEYNRLVRALRAIAPLCGPGVSLRQTPLGTVISAQGGGGAGAAAPRPWTFTISVEEEGGEKTYTAQWGGMTVQYGYQIITLDPNPGGSGLALARDGVAKWEGNSMAALAQQCTGTHWLKVFFMENEYSIVVKSDNQPPQDDLINSIVHIRIGSVASSSGMLAQTTGIYTVPVLYKYV